MLLKLDFCLWSEIACRLADLLISLKNNKTGTRPEAQCECYDELQKKIMTRFNTLKVEIIYFAMHLLYKLVYWSFLQSNIKML